MSNPPWRTAHALAALVVLLLVAGGALAPLELNLPAPRTALAAPLTVINTADSGAGSLRQALADAVAGDTITFSVPASSTITLASTLVVDKQLTIDGSAVAGLSVSGNQTVRVFSSSAPLTLTALRIINGKVTGLGSPGLGGGLSTTTAVTLTNVTFFNNAASSGGGLAALAGGVTVRDTQFISNTATVNGGGLLSSGTLTMSDTQLISNTAGIDGGGVILLGTQTGSIIGRSVFRANSAANEGGALYVSGAIGTRVQASQLIGNRATASGGAIYFTGSSAQMDNNILAGNSSSGAADIGVGTPFSTIGARHNTFVAAVAGQGVAINGGGDGNNDALTLTNSIFSDYGTALRTGPGAATITANGVLWSNVTTQTQRLAGSITVTNAYTGTAGFVNPAARDYHLQRTSAAIDKGVGTSLTTDIDGQARSAGSAPDLGADEFVNSAPTITNIADQTTNVGVVVGPIPFTVGDANADSLTVTVSSSNTTLVPNANIVLGGSGANRTLTITPAPGASGTATITVTVSDGQAQASDTFVLTVGGYKLYLPLARR